MRRSITIGLLVPADTPEVDVPAVPLITCRGELPTIVLKPREVNYGALGRDVVLPDDEYGCEKTSSIP